jgi:hypothetical protein
MEIPHEVRKAQSDAEKDFKNLSKWLMQGKGRLRRFKNGFEVLIDEVIPNKYEVVIISPGDGDKRYAVEPFPTTEREALEFALNCYKANLISYGVVNAVEIEPGMSN